MFCRHTFFAVTLILYLAGQAHAAEYFVSATTGDDTHDGRSPQTAWQTLAAANTAKLQPGDTVRFRAGDTWRGDLKPQSGKDGSPVTYTRYGDGVKPAILGSVALKACWTPAGENLWQTDAAMSEQLAVDVGNLIFNGDTAGWKHWSRDELKQQGDYFYDSAAKCVVLYSEKQPDEVYTTMEAALHRHIINMSGTSWCVFDGLAMRYGAAHGFGGSTTAHHIIRNCDLSWIGGAHQFTREDGHPVRYGNAVEFWSDARDHLVENNRIWEVYDAALTNQGDGVNVQKNITYRGNEVWNCEYSFEYWNRGPESVTDNILVENNTFRDAGYGWGHAQRPDPNGRHIMIYDNPAKTTAVRIINNRMERATESILRVTATRGQESPTHQGDGAIPWTRELELDHNVYTLTPGTPFALWGNMNYTFPEFQNATGKEKDGTCE